MNNARKLNKKKRKWSIQWIWIAERTSWMDGWMNVGREWDIKAKWRQHNFSGAFYVVILHESNETMINDSDGFLSVFTLSFLFFFLCFVFNSFVCGSWRTRWNVMKREWKKRGSIRHPNSYSTRRTLSCLSFSSSLIFFMILPFPLTTPNIGDCRRGEKKVS